MGGLERSERGEAALWGNRLQQLLSRLSVSRTLPLCRLCRLPLVVLVALWQAQ